MTLTERTFSLDFYGQILITIPSSFILTLSCAVSLNARLREILKETRTAEIIEKKVKKSIIIGTRKGHEAGEHCIRIGTEYNDSQSWTIVVEIAQALCPGIASVGCPPGAAC